MTNKLIALLLLTWVAASSGPVTLDYSNNTGLYLIIKPEIMNVSQDQERCSSIAPGVAVVGSYNYNSGRLTLSLPDPITGKLTAFTGTPEAISRKLSIASTLWRENALQGVRKPRKFGTVADDANEAKRLETAARDYYNDLPRARTDKAAFGPDASKK